MYNGILLALSLALLSCENGPDSSSKTTGDGGSVQNKQVIVSCVCKGQNTALILGKGASEDMAKEDAKNKCKSISSTYSVNNCRKR